MNYLLDIKWTKIDDCDTTIQIDVINIDMKTSAFPASFAQEAGGAFIWRLSVPR